VIEWGKVPWTLWIFAVTIIVVVVLFEVHVSGPALAKALFSILMFGWLFFLLKGVRWVWIMTIGIYVIGLLVELVGSATWHGVILSLISLALLLLPVTRRYFSSEPEAASG
jgi:hypothetical protein